SLFYETFLRGVSSISKKIKKDFLSIKNNAPFEEQAALLRTKPLNYYTQHNAQTINRIAKIFRSAKPTANSCVLVLEK
ncbi:18826_t:CDS:2, partial [Gigaspora rosea]